MSEPTVPTGPIEERPAGFMPDEAQRALILEALSTAGVELGAYDIRMATWLAGWDWPTVAVIASWLHRAASRPADEAEDEPASTAPSRADVLREAADELVHAGQLHAAAHLRRLADETDADTDGGAR
ncbi:hypothetical protein FH609_004295 [Streptomyces sp. 3MP-14]|uniref:Uncharacterized protein n=1 Tax=Streptomyces mimosae TaxID=2586635 RepID=A0A5N6A3X8_9ACTN|nr:MULTISPECIES: hypothetical protein [Streptomyces]KAB8162952.1 hypothetical protein FH607_020155 [Streptomyces mimosae]KAB8179166.1 hypothetical protein FH609_004295 [Streptomyces sp. 3MP-14]